MLQCRCPLLYIVVDFTNLRPVNGHIFRFSVFLNRTVTKKKFFGRTQFLEFDLLRTYFFISSSEIGFLGVFTA